MGFLMPLHPFPNFEVQRYYENEPRFNGVFSTNNLPKKIKDGAYVINLDEYADVGTHWITLFFNRNEIVYFDSFSDEYVPVGNKNIKGNIFRVQASDSVTCGYFCIGFIDFMLAGKKSTDYTSLFSPHDFEKNDQTILSWMNENNFIEAIDRTNLTEQIETRLDKITEFEDYFYHEINQRKSCSKN